MPVLIDANDPRSIRAIEIAGQAGQWIKVTTKDGERAYGVQSQREPGRYYIVTLGSCTCEDFKRNGLTETRIGLSGEHQTCKHVRAVRLHEELVAAVSDKTPSGRRRHLHLVPKVAASDLADRCDDIFSKFED